MTQDSNNVVKKIYIKEKAELNRKVANVQNTLKKKCDENNIGLQKSKKRKVSIVTDTKNTRLAVAAKFLKAKKNKRMENKQKFYNSESMRGYDLSRVFN